MTDALLCQICGRPIPWRPLQGPGARACSPGCAGSLFKAENPAEKFWSKKPETAAKAVVDGVRVEESEDDDHGT